MPSAIILKNKNTYSWTPLQQPPWGQKKVDIEERLKQVNRVNLWTVCPKKWPLQGCQK